MKVKFCKDIQDIQAGNNKSMLENWTGSLENVT